jgi:hypothetical protein
VTNNTTPDTPAKRPNDALEQNGPAFDEAEAFRILLEVFGPAKLRGMMRIRKLLKE